MGDDFRPMMPDPRRQLDAVRAVASAQRNR
jgi:hypothetical protein